jgi:signal transduction histidine kinase
MVEDSVAADRAQLERRVDELTELGFRLRDSEHFDRMAEVGAEARALAEPIGYRAGLAKSLGVLAFAHYMRSELHLAVEECMQALELVKDDPITEGRLRGILTLVHWSLGNYDQMTREGERTMELLARSPERMDEAFAWVSRAGIAHSLRDYETALNYSNRALRVLEIRDNLVARGRAYAQAGAAHLELGEPERALELHEKSLACGREADNRLLMSRALNEIGATRLRIGDLDQAETALQEALEIRLGAGYLGPAVTSLLDLARLCVRKGALDEAMEHAARAEEIAARIGTRPKLAEAHLLLSEIHEKRGDLGEALRRLKVHQALRESITGEQTKLRLESMRLMAQIEALRAEQAETVNTEKMAAIGGLVGVLAHEMNSPLGAIRSSADTMVRATQKLSENGVSEILRGNAAVVSQAAERISLTLRQIRSFAGLDLAEFREADLIEGLDQAMEIVSPEYGDRIRFVREFQTIPRVRCYAAQLNQVFLHILRNACESIDGEGEVSVSARCGDPWIQISFRDNGRGIPPDVLPTIFNPGFKRENQRVRAALSLFTCMNIVQKHNGTIEARSAVGRGSTFLISLPSELPIAA